MSYNRDPLYYHTKVNFDELLEKREKAIWFQIDGIKTWMPIKCCKELDEESKTVYIWTKVLESNMMKAREYIENLKQTKDRKDIDQDRDKDKDQDKLE